LTVNLTYNIHGSFFSSARGESSRAESALRETLEGSATELDTRIKQCQDEAVRSLETLQNRLERERETEKEEELEEWRRETDELLRKKLDEARDEWKETKTKELEKSLAFWRNTWDVEKDRAIQEALVEEQKNWEKSISVRLDAK
jgi:hypothetical protein